tara:strand:+ start:93 stop:257 length:165 start_codon:yes stop_codon:yes gene_type:complete
MTVGSLSLGSDNTIGASSFSFWNQLRLRHQQLDLSHENRTAASHPVHLVEAPFE